MKSLAAALPLAALFTALAGPALADIKDDYMKACMEASRDNSELCTCKSEQAVKLADEEMLGYIILNMQDPEKFSTMVKEGAVPEGVTGKWGLYVMKSNIACRPGS